jgi:hypothetical protein
MCVNDVAGIMCWAVPVPGSGSDRKTMGSMSGDSSVVRPTHASMSASYLSTMTSSSCPTRDCAKSSLISSCQGP